MAANPRAGQPAQPEDLIDVAQVVTAYYTAATRPGERRPAGGVRDVGPPRVEPRHRVQRGAHPGDDAGDRRVPRRAGDDGSAVHRPRHPRAVRAGLGVGAGGAGRQRRRGDDRRRRPLHAHARGQPRDPGVQPGPRQRSGRRHRRHPVAQPAARRRLQVQPAQRRSGRYRRDRRHRQARQRDSARRPGGREADPAGAGAADRPAPRLPERLRRGSAERRRHPRDPGRGDPDRRRSARRRQRRLLGRDRRDARPRT